MTERIKLLSAKVGRFSRTHPILSVSAIGLAISIPCVLLGLLMQSDDAVIHYTYQKSFSEQFWRGEIYPRWLSEQNGGLGSPTFFYYPPLPYYITAALAVLPVSIAHQLGVALAMTVTLSGISAFLWLRRETSSNSAAIFAASIYMLLPYRTMDIFDRGAFAECWGFVWMPLILLFIHGLRQNKPRYVAALAVGVAALALSHLLTAMMFLPLAGAYSLFLAARSRSWYIPAATAIGSGLGLGLAAVYIVPATSTQDFVSMERMVQGHEYFANSFLSFSARIDGSLKYFHLTYQVVFFTVISLLRAWVCRAQHSWSGLCFWVLVFSSAVIMTTSLSEPVWRILYPLQWLQFPWRFHTVASVAAVGVFAHSSACTSKSLGSGWRRMLALATLIFALIWVSDIARKTFRAITVPAEAFANYNEKASFVANRMDSAAFLPKSVPGQFSSTRDHLVRIPGEVLDYPRARFIQGNGSIVLEQWRPRTISLLVTSQDTATLEVGQLYYPGWIAETTAPVELKTFVSPSTGLVAVTLPPGEHLIKLELRPLTSEIVGWFITGGCAIVVAFIALLPRATMRTARFVAVS